MDIQQKSHNWLKKVPKSGILSILCGTVEKSPKKDKISTKSGNVGISANCYRLNFICISWSANKTSSQPNSTLYTAITNRFALFLSVRVTAASLCSASRFWNSSSNSSWYQAVISLAKIHVCLACVSNNDTNTTDDILLRRIACIAQVAGYFYSWSSVVGWSVCLCLSVSWSCSSFLQKWLNRSRRCLTGWLRWAWGRSPMNPVAGNKLAILSGWTDQTAIWGMLANSRNHAVLDGVKFGRIHLPPLPWGVTGQRCSHMSKNNDHRTQLHQTPSEFWL